MTSDRHLTVGVLALQGAFIEHLHLLSRIRLPASTHLSTLAVRTPEDLSLCDALIIPGGESTTMALVAKRTGMLEPLREFVRKEAKAVWGTCAGCILLADEVEEGSKKKGGQEGIGGLPMRVVRNQFGRQVESFEEPLYIEGLRDPETPFLGIFIRAPMMHTLLDTPTPLDVLSRLDATALPVPNDEQLPLGPDARVVAVRRGRVMATSFHPELTTDPRLHEYFVASCLLSSVVSAKVQSGIS